jgi:adenylate cyclase
MKDSDSPNTIEFTAVFSRFRLYLNDQRLYRLDHAIGEVPVRLGNPAFHLLTKLLGQTGKPVSKKSLIEAAWEGKGNGGDWDDNLRVEINKLRTSLGENARNSCIRTTFEGYAYVAPGECPDPLPSLTPPRLSIIVLPFRDLSENKRYQYFADGIADDLTTDLSRIEGMFVISRSTSDTFRETRLGAKQICHEVRVRYALVGSVRRTDERFHVNAQLIDADTDAHLWAERFDRETGDLDALQNEITSLIAIALNAELVNAQAIRPAEHPDALDYVFRGRAAFWRSPSRESYAQAIAMFERALALDAHSVEAQTWLASVLAVRVLDLMSDSVAADNARAQELVEQALAVSPRSSLAHWAKGQVLRAQNRIVEAIPEYETAILLNRNWVYSYPALGQCRLLTGSIDEVIPLQKQAIRLSPCDPKIAFWYYRIGHVQLVQSRIDEAIRWFEKARNAMPTYPYFHAHLASAYALKGDTECAAAELAEARRLSPDGRYSSVASLKTDGYFAVPTIPAVFETTFFAGLRKAGMPEE